MQNLVYEWVDFSKFGQIWAKIGSNLRKFWKKLVILFMVYEWVTFSWKIGICMGLLSNSVAAHPYQNQTWVPPGPGFGNYAGTSVHSVQRGLKPTLFLFISLYIKPHFLQKQTYPAFCRSCFSKISMMQIYTTPLNTTIFLTIVCLRRESNFLASTRPVTALCVCCIICVQAHA